MPLYYYVVMFVRFSLAIKGYLLTYLLTYLLKIILYCRYLEGVRASPDFNVYEQLCRGEELPRTVRAFSYLKLLSLTTLAFLLTSLSLKTDSGNCINRMLSKYISSLITVVWSRFVNLFINEIVELS